MTGTGEIVGGAVHIHAAMAVEGDRAMAQIGTHFARVYVIAI